MARKTYRTFRFEWKVDDGDSQVVDVFAPSILLNLSMVDRRLKKAELKTFGEIVQDENYDAWRKQSELEVDIAAANQFFDENPESIPFGDILCEEIPPLLEAIRGIPTHAQVRCHAVDR